MNTTELLEKAVSAGASDIFVVAGRPVSMRIHGDIRMEDNTRLLPDDTRRIIEQIYELAGHRDIGILKDTGDDDFSFAVPGLSAFKQRGSLSVVIRIISFTLPDPATFGIPEKIIRFADFSKGMVLVTGPAGSGKSTTLACIIDHINKNYDKHIITLEIPLEFLHRHNRSIVSQREINVDTENYVTALRASLRQSPDVILLGEMRDYETIQTAMTAAETGHLILSSLHTTGAANTIGRIVDVFEPAQQRQISIQLSMVLQAVISQQLIPDINGHTIPAFEVMRLNPAIRNMIRDNKVHQIDGVIASSAHEHMRSMDQSLLELYKQNKITKETALKFASNADMLKRKL